MAIKYNPYNWEIRENKTIKSIKKKNNNLFKVKFEIEADVTREELISLFHDTAKNITEEQ